MATQQPGRAHDVQDVRSLVGEVLEIAPDQIEEDLDFVEAYGVDSLRVIELLAAVERKYRVVLPDEKVERLRTLRGVMDVVDEALAGGRA
ncbi:MAG: acyl carrier protein [Vicinamibacteria bacterium]